MLTDEIVKCVSIVVGNRQVEASYCIGKIKLLTIGNLKMGCKFRKLSLTEGGSFWRNVGRQQVELLRFYRPLLLTDMISLVESSAHI